MSCEICGHAVSASSRKKGKAVVCHACRESDYPFTVVLTELVNGEIHLGLNPNTAAQSESEPVNRVVPMELPRYGVAMLLDLQRRAYDLNDANALALLGFIEDDLVDAVAKRIRRM